MNFLRKWLFRLFLVLVAVFALLAGADNSTPVPLSLAGWQSPVLPMWVWVFMAFVLGGLFGMMTNLWSNTQLRLESRKTSKALEQSNQQLDKARSETPEGS